MFFGLIFFLVRFFGYIALVFGIITFVFPLDDPAYYGTVSNRSHLSDVDHLKRLMAQKKKQSPSAPVPTEQKSTGVISDSDKLREKRRNIKAEILSTERTYVHNLNVLHDVFLVPIREKKIVNEKTLNTIFSREIDMILEINRMFLTQLEQILEGDLTESTTTNKGNHGSEVEQSEKLAELLLKHAHSFKLYIGYVSHYSIAVSTLRSEMESNKKLNQLLLEKKKILQTQGERVTQIQDYLINPIQRLPRYRLLFQDLLEKTELNHPSYQQLKKAVDLIKDVISTVNEKEGELKNQLIMLDLHKRVMKKVPDFIAPTRRLRAHCDDQNVSIVLEGNKMEPCFLYIFSDLIICIYQQKGLKKKEKVIAQYIMEHQVTEKGRVDSVKIVPTGTSKNQCNLKIDTVYGSSPMLQTKKAQTTTESIHISCSSSECRDHIMLHLNKVNT